MGEEICGDPGSRIVGALVALPSNQVAELTLQAVVDFGVQDFRDLVLLLVVNFHRRGRLNFAVRNGAGFVGFKLRDVEDGVNGSHILGKLDLDGVGAGASDDLVRTKILLRELLRRSPSLYELSEEEDFGSDRKLRGRHAVAVRRNLITLLSFSNRFLDLSMKFIEIRNKLAGPVGSDFLIQGRGKVRVVAFVRKERKNAGSVIHSVVVSELGHGEERRPVVLLIGAEDLEDLFEGLVNTLSLSIGFQVVPGGEVEIHVQSFPQGTEEDRHKLRAAVGSNVSRYTMFGEDISNKEFGQASRVYGVRGRNEDALLGESVNNDEDSGEARGFGKVFNEVHGDGVPRT